MKTVAVIIKHPFRDYDWRVDICNVTDETTDDQIYDQVKKEMLGPFEIMAITSRVNKDRKLATNSTLSDLASLEDKEKLMKSKQEEEIPQWVIDYDKANWQSSAGKAVRILMNKVTELQSEIKKLNDKQNGDGKL